MRVQANNIAVAIDQILQYCDFETIHRYMQNTEWYWGAPSHIPSKDELKTTARSLLEEAARSERECTSISTGGFHAHKWTWDNGQVELELLFSIACWDESI